MWLLFVTALIPLAVGAIYYNPKVAGKAWMESSGMTEEKMKGSNMLIIFGFTYLLGLLLSFILSGFIVHQLGIFGAFYHTDFETEGTQAYTAFQSVMAEVGNEERNWKHGISHGIMAALFFAWPVIAIQSMFERRGKKYTAVHLGYWVITLTLMGGIISAYF